MIRLQAGTYELIEEHRNGWNPEAFKERYSDILDKYDYVVGDWGYGQLRLRGFFENSNRKAPFDQKIAALDEYIQEFCNFGCAYFVLKRTKVGVSETSPNAREEHEFELYDSDEQQIGTESTSAPRQESASRYPRRHERADRTDRNATHRSQDGKTKGEKPARFDKQSRAHRQDRDRNGDRSGKHDQASREKRAHQPNRFSRDKVPTSTVETPRNQ